MVMCLRCLAGDFPSVTSLPPPEPSARPDERAGRRMLLFSSTTSFVGDVGEAGAAGAGGPSSELEVRAMSLQAFEVLDHGC